MSTLPLHPALVHLPLGLAFVLPLAAIAIAVVAWRKGVPRRAVAAVAGLQALLVAGALVAMQAGERDEKRVERLVPEAVIEAHEERAEQFTWAAGAVLAGMLGLLVLPPAAARGTAAAVAAASVAVAGLALRTGEAGGELVYRHGAAAAYAAAGPASAAPAQRHHDDD